MTYTQQHAEDDRQGYSDYYRLSRDGVLNNNAMHLVLTFFLIKKNSGTALGGRAYRDLYNVGYDDDRPVDGAIDLYMTPAMGKIFALPCVSIASYLTKYSGLPSVTRNTGLVSRGCGYTFIVR